MTKVKLSEIRVVDLNSKTMILLTQFVRLARLHEDADLKMQQKDVVRRVFKFAAATDNPDLIILFMKIRQHLVNHVINANLEKPSFNLYKNVA